MKNFIDRYVRNCHTCKRSKALRDRYVELLNFLSISNKSWTNITMNFVIELFINHEFNAILMIINRFTKMHHYISCTIIDEDITVEETAPLLIDYVWKLHEFSNILYQIENLNLYHWYEKSCVAFCKSTQNFQSRFISRWMNKARSLIKKWNVIYAVIAIISKTIDRNDYRWSSSL
jgi:hypothetical protein